MALITSGVQKRRVGLQNRAALLAQVNENGTYLVKRILKEIASELISDLGDARKYAQSNIFWRGLIPKNPEFGPSTYTGGAPPRRMYIRTGEAKASRNIEFGLRFQTGTRVFSDRRSSRLGTLRRVQNDIDKIDDARIFKQIKHTTRGAPFRFEYYMASTAQSGHPGSREPYGEIQANGFWHNWGEYQVPGTDWLGLALETKVNQRKVSL